MALSTLNKGKIPLNGVTALLEITPALSTKRFLVAKYLKVSMWRAEMKTNLVIKKPNRAQTKDSELKDYSCNNK